MPALPASWDAMLPQKFSPATMFNVFAGLLALAATAPVVDADGDVEPEHAPTATAAATATAPTSRWRPGRAVPTRRPRPAAVFMARSLTRNSSYSQEEISIRSSKNSRNRSYLPGEGTVRGKGNGNDGTWRPAQLWTVTVVPTTAPA